MPIVLPGSTFSPGITTSSKNSAPVADARSENLRSISGRRETLHAALDDEAADALVGARPDDAESAMGAFVIHIFDRQDPVAPRRRAWRFMPRGRAAVRSVGPKQPISSPFGHAGQEPLRCASLPNAWIGYMQRLDCTGHEARIPESPAFELLDR
jgi:hypothetical protein